MLVFGEPAVETRTAFRPAPGGDDEKRHGRHDGQQQAYQAQEEGEESGEVPEVSGHGGLRWGEAGRSRRCQSSRPFAIMPPFLSYVVFSMRNMLMMRVFPCAAALFFQLRLWPSLFRFLTSVLKVCSAFPPVRFSPICR